MKILQEANLGFSIRRVNDALNENVLAGCMTSALRISFVCTGREIAPCAIRSGLANITWVRRPSQHLQSIELPAGDDRQIIVQDLQ